MTEKDYKIERLRRSGPGGQHRNKRATGIRLTHLPSGAVVMATEERSQATNLERAKVRMDERLKRASEKPKRRKKTRVPPNEREKRIRSKKVRSERKKMRQRVRPDE